MVGLGIGESYSWVDGFPSHCPRIVSILFRAEAERPGRYRSNAPLFLLLPARRDIPAQLTGAQAGHKDVTRRIRIAVLLSRAGHTPENAFAPATAAARTTCRTPGSVTGTRQPTNRIP